MEDKKIKKTKKTHKRTEIDHENANAVVQNEPKLKKKIKTEKIKETTSDLVAHNQKKIKKTPTEEVPIKKEVINEHSKSKKKNKVVGKELATTEKNNQTKKSKKMKKAAELPIKETEEKPKKKSNKSEAKSEVLTTQESENPDKSEKKKKSRVKSNRFNKKSTEEISKPVTLISQLIIMNFIQGVVYVSHLPYGFIEEGIKSFFSQYGDVKNVQLARSSKTARSKGYAFVEFEVKEVANIAAQAINGYLMYGKQLICKVVEGNEGNGIKVSSKKFSYIPHKRHFIKEKNMVFCLLNM